MLNQGSELTVVLGAGALSLVVGSSDVMAAQLDHLRRLDREGTVTVRALPWTAGAYPARGSFDLLDFDDADDPSVVYVEFGTGARYVEQPPQVAEYERVFEVLMDRTIPIEEWT